ncbi:MAG: nucleotidyl transferase AbiEii/AbiGii toxin family protein [Actinomycetota bacterium]
MTYDPELTRAVRRALYRLRWKLGRAWGERVVLVGGLVPPFLVPEPAPGVAAHVGTSDIDLAVGVFAAEEEAYVSLVRAVKDCGFTQRQPDEPSFRWFAIQDDIEVVLEILCPEDEEIQRRIRRKVEVDGGSELAALQVRGVELAARDFVEVALDEEVTELGERGAIGLRVVGPTTLLALKAQALADIDKPKHAYDIVWLCDAWPHDAGEPHGAAALAHVIQASAVRGEPFITESLATMRALFASPTAPGPVAYAQTVGGDSPRLEQLSRYASGLITGLLDAIERSG